MNIYEEPITQGVIDIAKTRDELKKTGAMTSPNERRLAIAEISAATMLDIAASLRVVAAEASYAMPSPADMLDEAVGNQGSAPDAVPDFFVEGDRVIAKVEGGTVTATIASLGVTEGAIYAELIFDETEDQPSSKGRAWVEYLERVVETPDETDPTPHADDPAEDDESVQAIADAAGLVDDDIDSDFEGDTHTAAANALETLKANETARKAAKKKGKKP